MNRTTKCMLTLVLASLLMLTSKLPVFASEMPTSAVYDLEKGGTQTFLIKNEKGEIDEIVIVEIKDNTKVDNGTYNVYYKASAWTAGFYIKVSNNKITSAYSPYHSVSIGSITNALLTKNSTTKVTYSFNYTALLTYKTGLIATISNSELIISRI